MIKTCTLVACLFAGAVFSAPARAELRAEPIVVAQSVNVNVRAEPRVRRGAVVRERTVIRRHHPRARTAVIVRHDRGLHRGWSHAPAYGARRTVIVKKRGPLGMNRTTTIIRER